MKLRIAEISADSSCFESDGSHQKWDIEKQSHRTNRKTKRNVADIPQPDEQQKRSLVSVQSPPTDGLNRPQFRKKKASGAGKIVALVVVVVGTHGIGNELSQLQQLESRCGHGGRDSRARGCRRGRMYTAGIRFAAMALQVHQGGGRGAHH